MRFFVEVFVRRGLCVFSAPLFNRPEETLGLSARMNTLMRFTINSSSKLMLDM